jgi:hypothetical protein
MAYKGKREQKTFVEEIIVVSGVVIAGVALQFFTGGFDKAFLAFPVNVILLLPLIALFFVKRVALERVASGSLSIILLIVFTIAALYMGLIPGNQVKVSWPFVLIYLMILINLTAVISCRVKRFKIGDIAFLLNHAGLMLLLYSAGPGSADKSRYFMRVNEGGTEWRAQLSGRDSQDKLTELPVAIYLDDFVLEEYPPRIAVIDRGTGEAMPVNRPLYLESIKGRSAVVMDWKISVDSFINLPRYAPTAYLTISNLQEEEIVSDWITCGNFFQNFRTINLSDRYCIAMTFPEPKRFISRIEVYSKSGESRVDSVMVNHPVTIGSWKVYQHSYNTQMGKDSDWSLFELVYDPWLIPALTGIILMLLGSVALIWTGGKR